MVLVLVLGIDLGLVIGLGLVLIMFNTRFWIIFRIKLKAGVSPELSLVRDSYSVTVGIWAGNMAQ